MLRAALFLAVAAALALSLAARPARADFSACGSAFEAKTDRQRVELYSICLKHGGLAATDVAGAFNNRGIAYWNLGEMDKALQDFTWAIQYDPSWPLFRTNRARIEAGRGQCAQALADMDAALKMAPHSKEFLELKASMVAGCPGDQAPKDR